MFYKIFCDFHHFFIIFCLIFQEKVINVTNEPDLKEYELPFNWTKQCKRRKSGNTWDVYVTHGSSGKRFRSNVAIDDYLTNNPEVKCNRELTNCKYPLPYQLKY